jgi:hypothetical protein
MFLLLNYLEQLSNWVPHRGVPRRLGELYFWILDIHLHTPHTIEFFLAWHFFFFFFLCKQFFNIILLVQKQKPDIYITLHGLTHIYMMSKCKSLNTLTLVQVYMIQNQFTRFYTLQARYLHLH